MFKISELKIGDNVEVVCSLFTYDSYTSQLSDFIGRIGKITNMNSTSYRVTIEDGNSWWYPRASLMKIGDTMHIKDIITNSYSYVGHMFVGIDINQYIDIVKELHTDNNLQLDEYYSRVTNLCGNKVKIISVNNQFTIMGDCYVGVLYQNDVYYIPKCMLFQTIPSYIPRKIIKII